MARHIVVTGAGTGIGRAVAERMAEEGAVLTLLARRREQLEETASALAANTGEPHGVSVCDIRERAQVDEAFAEAARARGPIVALIAVSGIGGANNDGADDRFDDIVRTNLNGTYYCCAAALRHLADGPAARHLVIVSSILARIGVPAYTGYSASKAGLLGLVRAYAAELGDRNVQVNAVCPGWVETEMAWSGLDGIAEAGETTREEAYENAMREVPLGRMSTPAEIANTVAWLLTATGVTGQAIDHNGGAWMG